MFFKCIVTFAIVIIVNNALSQNNGELVGSNNLSVELNYKIPGNNDEVVEGFSFNDFKRQQNNNIKYQEKFKKDLLKSHVLKQTKHTRKRMKKTLKKSQRYLAGKPVVPIWQVWIKRKKLFKNEKQNDNED